MWQLMLPTLLIQSCLLTSGTTVGAGEPVFVFLSHGTWGGQGDWTRLLDGKATFASELLRALPEGSQVRPILYRGENTHQTRIEAAAHLAELIDSEATAGFSRICLVGHSHGGNVCLRAAGLCRKSVDCVICMSTPHCYLQTRKAPDRRLRLPVYCSPQSLSNSRKLLSVTPSGDLVAKLYAGLSPGISDNEASFCTTAWQEQYNYPRLRYDSPLADFFRIRNVEVTTTLAISSPDCHNMLLYSASDDSLGIEPHHQIHSRRSGYVMGIVLREQCSPPAMAYLRALIHAPDADDGGPTLLATHRKWLNDNSESLSFCGWVLRAVDLEFVPAARVAAGDFDRSQPDPVVVVEDGETEIGRSAVEVDASRATLSVGAFFPMGRRLLIDIRDQDIFTSHSLGAVLIECGDQMPTRVLPASERGRYWGAELHWEWVHY